MNETFAGGAVGADPIATLTAMRDGKTVTAADARISYNQAITALEVLRDTKPAYWVVEADGISPMLWDVEPVSNYGVIRKLFYAPQDHAPDAADPDAAAKAYAESMGERWENMGEEARQRARNNSARLEDARRASPTRLAESTEPAGEGGLCCADCDLPYGSKGYADFVVPDDVWERISPTGGGGGILCANCMVRRAAELGIECEGSFTSGPFANHGWRKPGVLKRDDLAVCMYDDGSAFMAGRVGGYVEGPSYIFSNHEFQSWPASRVRAPSIEEEAKYWRERALQAEALARKQA